MEDHTKEQSAEERLLSDLNIVDWLIHFDFEPTGTYLNKATDIVFVKFKDTPELRQTIQNFYSGDATLNARKWLDAQRKTRQMVKQARKGGAR